MVCKAHPLLSLPSPLAFLPAAGTGWDAIQEQVKKLEKRHAVHIAGYGEGNERRLTGGPGWWWCVARAQCMREWVGAPCGLAGG